MSLVADCPVCQGRAKIKQDKITQEITYKAIQDEEAFKKIGQLKKAMRNAIDKAKALETELASLKAQYSLAE